MSGKRDPTKATFIEFYNIYRDMMQWTIPDVHYVLIDFLGTDNPFVLFTALIQCFRGFSKSTIVGVYCAWRLYQDQTLRIIVISGDIKKAGKMLKHVKAILDRHPLTMGFTGKDLEDSATGFRIYGNPDERSSSLACYGTTSNMTAARGDLCVYDDIETPKNSNTEGKREALREMVSESFYLLAPQKREQIFVGTPHTEFTIYEEIQEQGCSSIKIPLMTEFTGTFPNFKGSTEWPEVFDEKYLHDVQIKSKSESMFRAQYLLQNKNLNEAALNSDLVLLYDEEPRIVLVDRSIKRLYLGDKLVVAVSPFWDVAANSAKGDTSALAITYITADGHFYIHRIVALQGEIIPQCKQIKDLVSEFYLKGITVETNAVGQTAPSLLRNELKYLTCSVIEHYETENKYKSIVEAFTIPLSAGIVHAHREVVENSLLFQQMSDLRPAMNGPDDYVDSAAKSMLVQPIRLIQPADVARGITDSSGGWQALVKDTHYTTEREHSYKKQLGRR